MVIRVVVIMMLIARLSYYSFRLNVKIYLSHFLFGPTSYNITVMTNANQRKNDNT